MTPRASGMSLTSACPPRERWEPACLGFPSQLGLSATEAELGALTVLCALVSPPALPLPVPVILTAPGWR